MKHHNVPTNSFHFSLLKLQEEQEEQHEKTTTAAGSTTLEWQLADIRKEVNRMQVRFMYLRLKCAVIQVQLSK